MLKTSIRDPRPLSPKVGSTLVMPYRRVFIRDGIPKPLPSKVGSTRVLQFRTFSERFTATVPADVLRKSQYPPPSTNKIGEEDLPGGFVHTSVINGQNHPMYDLSRGIVQIDGVAVFFDAKA